MKNKKILLAIFILVAIVQLYVPAKMILNNEDVLKTGKEFKFKTAPIDPNDPFRGKYITLRYDDNVTVFQTTGTWERNEEIYVTLEEDKKGFAKIKSVSRNKPSNTSNYVKAKVGYGIFKWQTSNRLIIDYSFNKFYMEETKAYDAEQLYNQNIRERNEKPAFALVAIKNGDAVLKDVIIDGVSVKKIVKNSSDKNN
jgi:uncharacterized membrane-anchored protein